ncbi:hypothetical protein NS228_14140 [Methylobacterium indicum]|uniref:Uncharacterized protein n=1 Tax=Methylobacterium indicum TaxID=1775910 RepID=A0A0J6QWC7_9HYPH|nr:hypothetical protein [Methylobacterium indicum]KMO15180.1 hypothetical protein QR79_24520 [Methylobacterium indicum]KMO17958.1 hypothetical protein QR78_16370 [Methylobacterium indicum]KTS24728.1 hypothetical protein NS229_21780 [Methylobacterium indicum]KTS39771.1 hypothetical protein NS228_14140 [Methylobacterium indicum]KTS44478.1 hypothetical protein NS230_25350 [Methylobacterium indicum]
MSGREDGRPGDGTREQRLKAALRDNLKRRKAQARGREAAEAEPEDSAAPPGTDRTAGDRR